MKKITYILLAASILFMAGCLKSGGGTLGPAGAAGTAGAPGGDLPALQIPFTLSSHTVTYGGGSYYFAQYVFTGYNPKYTYFLDVDVTRQSTPPAKESYTLPITNVYQTGDAIYSTIGDDTIKIWYFSPGATPWPDTAVMAANIIVIPKDTIIR